MRNSFRYIAISFNMIHSCGRLQSYKTLSLLKTGLGICLYTRWRSSPRLSLKDILNAVDMSAEFAWRKTLWFEIGKTEVEETLRNCESNCLVPFFKSCGKEGFARQILKLLDEGTHNLIFSLWLCSLECPKMHVILPPVYKSNVLYWQWWNIVIYVLKTFCNLKTVHLLPAWSDLLLLFFGEWK